MIYAAMACIVAGLVALMAAGARYEQQLEQLRLEKEECCGRDNQ